MNALIEAGGLHVYYGASHVLRGVDMHIAPGESVGLVGRNGMGKTTLIRSLMGHVKSAQGSVRVDGRDCTRAQPHAIARMGVAYVPEGRGIFPNLNVRENLQVAARAGRDGRQEWSYARVLDVFPRLKERLGHGGQQLSGGEQQMLAIGRALMTNPELLILDEATEGLAPLIVAEIWKIIRQIRASGMSTLIVDRNYRAVLEHTDRCLVMEKGQIVQDGDSASLARQPEQLTRYLGV
ncbi:ABC transporter ATP-binding protein [Achromobacter insolitus]|jgi:branched-chain amino acid transport system ATP-binding protein|uniref:High-affinity branched-chain amino acid transport ATP-binding protein LivF n=1 Tax=Achromobacter insolitus TaxID=217204 RepID=A0A6S7F7L8_9BURK|nr:MULTISPECIES: ABC transporter ATP-binding protein [Achromobacter]GLK95992.1 ABC transporter ATP-binding protein [Achromobacter xylosoxidans]AVG40780.1 ABC transporter ATP-binding protein [Achromobacter insolitus]AXA71463.1 ABC transporter ATP-binding protein [Achromobacter insolitus]MDH3063137.1 ABC transporter ATP-binding protein [Achromobacter insolitus]MEB3098738.1 ABC transporter ATP-binding protein [Achromobacter sp. D10]